MKFGSLFSGIGGMDLGLERVGMICSWQVEIDDYATKVLAKHWPTVPRFRDVRECGAHNLKSVDLICGGFPCQDISNAGKRAGIEGERSGLWSEFHRIICEVRPRYVLVENVAALLGRGMGRVLGDLAASGYDAEWDVVPACAVGAPHRRERVWIVAYARCAGLEKRDSIVGFPSQACRTDTRQTSILGGQVAYPQSIGGVGWRAGTERSRGAGTNGSGWWAFEPDVGRVADGISSRVDRLRGLGNACVPQVVQWIGEQILATERGKRRSSEQE